VILQELLVLAFEVLLENDPADVNVAVLVSKARFLLAVRRVEIRIVVDLASATDAGVERLRQPLTRRCDDSQARTQYGSSRSFHDFWQP
jgi:hypothetical protein